MNMRYFILIAAVALGGPVPRPSAEGAAFFSMHPADISGLVLYTDGETPAENVPVRVWDAHKREFILETETNEHGRYLLKALEPGEYYLTFDWTKLRLDIMPGPGDPDRQNLGVVVVIPRPVGFVNVHMLNTMLIAGSLSERAVMLGDEERMNQVSSP
ncbi:MAG TPA: carboxypeptidase-like regulatory domain-containing protein [Kiritimatiellia bacterium]|nr:carboxypeptidase-like regulatory domain-containing protein [Kiritimatiellia bacterium]HNR95201.1 carboxypeptidase-like regulatory domain-containing protein [Kiritimatiellia bacterium]